MYWLPWSCRTARPRAMPCAKPPKWRRTPWRSGSSASKRVARRAAWMPTHSAEQWSTATNTAAWPSPVTVVVRSVPHIVSIVSGMMVPSWVRGPRGEPAREGASRPCSRISRSTRRFEVRTPAMAQPRPDLAVALAVEGAGGEHRPDRLHEAGVRHRPDRPRAPRRLAARRLRGAGRRWSGRRPRPGRPGPGRRACR